MEPGGRADKLSNRFERFWVIRQIDRERRYLETAKKSITA
jgi:hypothetical protein